MNKRTENGGGGENLIKNTWTLFFFLGEFLFFVFLFFLSVLFFLIVWLSCSFSLALARSLALALARSPFAIIYNAKVCKMFTYSLGSPGG